MNWKPYNFERIANNQYYYSPLNFYFTKYWKTTGASCYRCDRNATFNTQIRHLHKICRYRNVNSPTNKVHLHIFCSNFSWKFRYHGFCISDFCCLFISFARVRNFQRSSKFISTPEDQMKSGIIYLNRLTWNLHETEAWTMNSKVKPINCMEMKEMLMIFISAYDHWIWRIKYTL